MLRLVLVSVLTLSLCLGGQAAQIALVPLDSRPANTYFPRMVAQMAGLEVLFPESIDFFQQPGDGRAIGEWLLRTQADAYIISTSMLAYGGLIASRVGALPLEEARERVAVIEELRELNPTTPIFVFDIIQRLAITVMNSQIGQYYSAVHQWAVLKDQVENLGQTDLAYELRSLETQIPASILSDYLSARERNHQINLEMLRLVSRGVIDYLILAQDDASAVGLHRAEREILRGEAQRLGILDRVIFFPGADEVDVILISRFITQHYGLDPQFALDYRSPSGEKWLAPFEDIPYGENVQRHIQALGGRIHPRAETILFSVTPGGQTYGFVLDIVDAIEAGRKVLIADVAITNRSEPEFTNALLREVSVLDLTGYAGWNTAGNTMGIALGQGVAAMARETLTGEARRRADQAALEFLLSRWAKDVVYKGGIQGQMESWTRQVGLDPWDIADPGRVHTELNRRLQGELDRLYAQFFAGRQWQGYQLPAQGQWEIGLVWPRLFEIQIEPNIPLN